MVYMDETPIVNDHEGEAAPLAGMHKNICPQCHQPVLPEYYFCPNCGKELKEKPLSTTIWAQIWLYAFTLVFMPMTSYLIYRYWKGMKYFRSEDPKAHHMGLISIALLIGTIIFVAWSLWAGFAWLQEYIKVQQSDPNYLGGFL